jgi:hypothetical protein
MTNAPSPRAAGANPFRLVAIFTLRPADYRCGDRGRGRLGTRVVLACGTHGEVDRAIWHRKSAARVRGAAVKLIDRQRHARLSRDPTCPASPRPGRDASPAD